MIRHSASALALSFVIGAHAQNITAVTTAPSVLTECTQISFTINGQLPNGISPTSFVPGTPVGNNYPITINTGSQAPGGAFSVNLNLGPYPAGNLTFTFTLIYQGNVADTEVVPRTINPGVNPDAGDYAEHEFCTSDPTVPLLSLLGGTPDPGGEWRDPFNNVVANGLFDPGVSPAGMYSYAFNVLPPCLPAFQTILLTYLPNNDPGTPGTVQVCANGSGPSLDLFTYLGGTPMMGGTWTKPGGGSHNGTYVPGVDPVGVYTYSVPGIAPCGASTATVTVQAVQPPNAGVGGPAIVCYNDPIVQLNQYVTGSPQTTGIWFDPSNFNIGTWNTVISALTSDAGNYTYVVYSTICANDTAVVNVSYLPPPCTPGFEELEGDVVRFDVMPNPNDGHMTLEVELRAGSDRVQLDVIDVNGRAVHTATLNGGAWMRQDLDLSTLSKGLYTVRLVSPDGRATRRVVIR